MLLISRKENNAKALGYFVKAHNIQTEFNDPNSGITLTNIANCYLKQNKLSEAKTYYDKAKPFVEKDPRALENGLIMLVFIIARKALLKKR